MTKRVCVTKRVRRFARDDCFLKIKLRKIKLDTSK